MAVRQTAASRCFRPARGGIKVLHMVASVTVAATRFRIFVTRMLARIGFRDSGFLLIVAVVIGVVTAAAAVGFHLLIRAVRDKLYGSVGEDILYGKGMMLLVLWPAMGGLVVGIITQERAPGRASRSGLRSLTARCCEGCIFRH